MESSEPLPRAADGRRAWLGPVLVGLLGLVAYRMLWLGPTPTRKDLESWLFRPSPLPELLVLAVAGWLLWMRRERLRSLPDRGSPLLASAFAILGTALFVWALLTRTVDLLLPSLAANGLALAGLARGWAGVRGSLLPALVLLLGSPLPKPIEDEIVWHLQVWTADAAAWLLAASGREFSQVGVILRKAPYSFEVIDSCSGFNGIVILTLVALIVRELFAGAGPREWLLVALAPPLGFALNVVRIAFVAASSDPQAFQADHTPQGLAVLTAGTGILYCVGWAMARKTPAGSSAAPNPPSLAAGGVRCGLVACGLALLAVLTSTLPGFSMGDPATGLPGVEFPERGSGWTSEPVPPQPLFEGVLPRSIHRRYALEGAAQQQPEIVDVLIAYEEVRNPGASRLLSSKLALPGPEWDLVSRSHERLWLLERDADLAVASQAPGGEHAVVYTWRARDRGLWRESWRSLLALESSPLRRERPRAAVRLVSYAPHDGQLVLDRAKQRLDRFIRVFREELAAL